MWVAGKIEEHRKWRRLNAGSYSRGVIIVSCAHSAPQNLCHPSADLIALIPIDLRLSRRQLRIHQKQTSTGFARLINMMAIAGTLLDFGPMRRIVQRNSRIQLRGYSETEQKDLLRPTII
jgi:hypothetical protein